MRILLTIILMAFMLPAAACGSGFLKGKTKIHNERITQLEQQVNGLYKAKTESGHVVEDIPKSRIPVDADGKPYWKVVDVEPNEKLENTKDAIGIFPGLGILAAAVGIAGKLANTFQKKKTQEEIDRRIKGEEDIGFLEEIMIGVSSGIEVGTTDGTIKGEVSKHLTTKQNDRFNDVTESARIAIASARRIKALVKSAS